MKHVFNTYIKFLYVVIALGIIILFGPNIYFGLFVDGTTVDAYRIDDAEFDRTTFGELATREQIQEGNPTLPKTGVSYHALKSGRGTIIAIRTFYDERMTMDEERYTKLTIWLPEFKDGIYDLADDNVIAYYSKGGAMWPKTDCSAQIKSGTLKIESDKVSVATKFICQRYGGKAIAKVEINDSWKLETLPISEVNFWIGKPGADHPLRETSRPK